MIDGARVKVPDIQGIVREGTLELLSTQVFIQFPEGDGVFLSIDEFKYQQKRIKP